MIALFIIYFIIISVLQRVNVKCTIYNSQSEIKRLVDINTNASNNELIRKSEHRKCIFSNNLYRYEFSKKFLSYGNQCFEELPKNKSPYDVRVLNRDVDDGDTISNSDIVASQYKLLPYPLLTENQLLTEHNFYQNHADKGPIEVFPTGTLETINHHFFQGNQNFRYITYFYNCNVVLIKYTGTYSF